MDFVLPSQVVDKGCFDALKPEASSRMLMEAADWHVQRRKSSAYTLELCTLARRKSSEFNLNHYDDQICETYIQA